MTTFYLQILKNKVASCTRFEIYKQTADRNETRSVHKKTISTWNKGISYRFYVQKNFVGNDLQNMHVYENKILG